MLNFSEFFALFLVPGLILLLAVVFYLVFIEEGE